MNRLRESLLREFGLGGRIWRSLESLAASRHGRYQIATVALTEPDQSPLEPNAWHIMPGMMLLAVGLLLTFASNGSAALPQSRGSEHGSTTPRRSVGAPANETIAGLDAERRAIDLKTETEEINASGELSIFRQMAAATDPSKRLTPDEARYAKELQERDYAALKAMSDRPSRSIQEARSRLEASRLALARAQKVMTSGISEKAARWESPGFSRCKSLFGSRGATALKPEVDRGDVHCQFFWGLYTLSEARTSSDETAGWAMVFDAGRKGSPEGQYALASSYLSGSHGLAQDLDEATLWLRRAAEQGHPLAGFYLQLMPALRAQQGR